MDLNEQLKGWLKQQAQPGSFIDKAGLGLAQAGQTIGQDAAAGAAIMNDPRNSWIGMNPVGKAVGSGLGIASMLLGQLSPKLERGLLLTGKTMRPYDTVQKDIDALETTLEKQGLDVTKLFDPSNPREAGLKGFMDYRPAPPELSALYRERYAVEAVEKGDFFNAVSQQTGLPDEEAKAALSALHINPQGMTAHFSETLNNWGTRTETNIENLYNHFAGKKYDDLGPQMAEFHWGGAADHPQLIGRTASGAPLDDTVLAQVQKVYNSVALNIGQGTINLTKKKGVLTLDDGKTLNMVPKGPP